MESELVPDAVFNGPTVIEAPCGKNKVTRLEIIWKSPDETAEDIEKRWADVYKILFDEVLRKMVADGKISGRN